MERVYNLHKDDKDDRDLFLAPARLRSGLLPKEYDLRPACPPVWDQGSQGSCTSHAGCAARVMLAKNSSLDLSRAFLYYKERELEGTTDQDAGASIRDICKATYKFGICPSADMPYNPDDYTTPPSEKALKNALPYNISAYKRLIGVADLQQALVTRRQPVLIGMQVYESMESGTVAQTGILPMPKKGEQLLGGHAVLVVGYHNTTGSFLKRLIQMLLGKYSAGYFVVRNSWGESWGQSGYFYMPYAYFIRYSFDSWIMQ